MAKRLPSNADLIREVESIRRRLSRYEALLGPSGAVPDGGTPPDWSQRLPAQDSLPHRSPEENEARFRDLSASLPGAVYQFLIRPDGSRAVPFMSESAADLFERPVFELTAAGMLFDDIHPDDLGALNDSIEKAREASSAWTHEFRIVTKTRRTKWLRGASRPRRLPDGGILWNGVLLDVTEHKQVEQALRRSEERFRAVFDSAAAMVAVADTTGRWTRVNQHMADMLGYSRTELCQMRSDDITYPGDWEQSRDLLRRLVGGEIGPYRITKRYLRKDGRTLWADLSVSPIHNEHGEIEAVLGVALDITAAQEAQEEIKRSHLFLQTVLNAFPGNVAVLDSNGRIVMVNDRWTEFGMAEGLAPTFRAVGADYLKVCREAQDPGQAMARQAADGIEAVLSGRRSQFEMEYPCSGPALPRWFRLQASGFTYEDRRWAVVAHIDITDRVQAEERLRLMGLVIEQIRDRVTITDLQGNITFVNEADCRAVNRSREQLVGSHISSYGENPECGATQREILEITRTRGEWRGEVVNRTPEGREVLVDCRMILVRDTAGEPVCLCGVGTDITERKRAEEALQAAEERLRLALWAGGMGTWDWDLQTNVIHWSDGHLALFGLRPGEFDGRYETFARCVHPEDLPGIAVEIERARASHRTYQQEYRVVWADGSIHWIRGQGEFYFDDGGRPVRMNGVVTDVTEQKRAQRQAEQRQAEFLHISRLSTLGEMSSGLAHELNQPLAAILSYGDASLRLTQGQAPDVSRIARNLGEIILQGERAGVIIRRMRALAKGRQPRFTATDLNDAVQNAATLVRWELAQNGMELDLRLAEGLPPVNADAIQIEQVLLNLIRNAIDAMRHHDGGPRLLTVRTMVLGEAEVRVEVCDAGVGLPPAAADRIFEPFFTTKPDGLGIGLSISHSIIAAHQGALGARPNPERGATFFFTLPARRPDVR